MSCCIQFHKFHFRKFYFSQGFFSLFAVFFQYFRKSTWKGNWNKKIKRKIKLCMFMKINLAQRKLLSCVSSNLTVFRFKQLWPMKEAGKVLPIQSLVRKCSEWETTKTPIFSAMDRKSFSCSDIDCVSETGHIRRPQTL